MILYNGPLAYSVDNFAMCSYLLMDYGYSFGCSDRLPPEIFELYIILLPFSCLICALESRACALPYIVHLFREPLTILCKIFPC
jgi:hypothetical protein